MTSADAAKFNRLLQAAGSAIDAGDSTAALLVFDDMTKFDAEMSDDERDRFEYLRDHILEPLAFDND